MGFPPSSTLAITYFQNNKQNELEKINYNAKPNPETTKYQLDLLSRLVFTSDGVVVGIIIRSVERYDLVKIKPTESKAEHQFCL